MCVCRRGGHRRRAWCSTSGFPQTAQHSSDVFVGHRRAFAGARAENCGRVVLLRLLLLLLVGMLLLLLLLLVGIVSVLVLLRGRLFVSQLAQRKHDVVGHLRVV